MADCYIVTGTSRGIGYEVCLSLLQRGYNVVGISRSEGNSPKVQQKFPRSFKYLIGDVCNEDDQTRLIDTATMHFEGIRGLVLNAGYFLI